MTRNHAWVCIKFGVGQIPYNNVQLARVHLCYTCNACVYRRTQMGERRAIRQLKQMKHINSRTYAHTNSKIHSAHGNGPMACVRVTSWILEAYQVRTHCAKPTLRISCIQQPVHIHVWRENAAAAIQTYIEIYARTCMCVRANTQFALFHGRINICAGALYNLNAHRSLSVSFFII